jgi:hypothetical protein
MHFNHYLPVHQEMMVLVDELNNDFEVPYYVYDGHKCGLGRWKRFAADRELADGDCLVFQLIERLKFKVRFNLFSARDYRWVFRKMKVPLFCMIGTQISMET